MASRVGRAFMRLPGGPSTGTGFQLGVDRAPTSVMLPIRRERCFALLGATVAFAVPFTAFTSLVLYHFYVRGAFLLDSGLLAYLAAHGGPALPTPHVLGGQSFFATHLAPIFLVTAQLRRWLPL